MSSDWVWQFNSAETSGCVTRELHKLQRRLLVLYFLTSLTDLARKVRLVLSQDTQCSSFACD
jgi:hypothetical protein